MLVNKNTDTDPASKPGHPDFYDFQHQWSAVVGLSAKINVIFRTVGRDDVSYELIDGDGQSMSRRQARYGGVVWKHETSLLALLVEELNILLEDQNVTVSEEDLHSTFDLANQLCQSRFGRSAQGGDVVLTIH
jgi:hypothetical protein